MPNTIKLTEHIQVDIEVMTPRGLYRDAVYFPVGAKPSDADIKIIARERADNWLAIVNAPPVEEPTPEPEFEVTCEDGAVILI